MPAQTTAIARFISERSWQRTLVEGFHACGWRVYWTWTSVHSPAGYPDLTAVHPVQHRTVWVEAKTERGRLSPAQIDWRDVLLAAGLEWYCLRPSQWPEAERVMRGERL